MSRNTLKCKKFLPLLPPSSEHIADPADAEKREIEKLQTKAKEIKSCGCGCGVGEKEKADGAVTVCPALGTLLCAGQATAT